MLRDPSITDTLRNEARAGTQFETRRFIDATLARFPPAYAMTRQVRRPFLLLTDGYAERFRRGSMVVVATLEAGRTEGNTGSLIFGAGSHRCPGANLAIAEMAAVVQLFVQTFEAQLVGEVPNADARLSLHMDGPLYVELIDVS